MGEGKGLGYTKSMPGLTVTSKRLVTSADDSTAQIDLGTEVRLHDGRCFKYVQFNEAFLIGQCAYIPTDVTVTNLTSATSTSSVSVTKTSAFTASKYNGGLEEYFFSTAGTDTGTGQTRRIVSNTASILTIDAAPTTAFDTTTDGFTYSPYRIAVTSGAEQRVCGVALAAQTSAYFGWIQKTGFIPLVNFVGGTDASAAGEGIVSSSTAGAAKGLTTAGTTADEADKSFGYALYATAMTAVAARGIAAMLNAF